MAAILKLRRGTSTPTLVESEIFFNTTSKTLVVGDGSTNHTLVKIGSNTGNVTLLGDLSASGTTILTTITGSNLYITENVSIDGNIHIGGHITLGSGSDGDLISVNASLSGSLIPDTNAVYDLGSISYKYRNLYVVSASIDNVSLPGSGILSSSNENFTDFSQSVDSRIIDNDNHISLIELFTGSQEDKNDTLATYTQSVDSDLTELFATASDHEERINNLNSVTGSYATTGSNIFFGNQEVNGDVSIIDGEFSVITGSGDLTSSLSFTHNLTGPNDGYAMLELRHDNNVYNDDIAIRLKTDFAGAYLDYKEDGTLYNILSVQSFVNRNIYIHRDTRLFQSSLRIDENLTVTGSLIVATDVYSPSFSGSFTGSFSGSLATQDGRLDNLELTSESHDSRLDSLELTSASHDSRLDQLEADSGSQSGRLDSLETFTSSQEDINSIYNSYTESNDTKWSTIQNVTSSILLFTQSADGRLDSIETYTHSLKEAIDVNGSDLTILGNLIVQGTQTSLNTTEVLVEDILLALASGSTTSVEADGGGIFISGANSSMTWNHSNQLMEFNTKVSSSVGFKGDGSELINIQHENIDFGGSNILSGSGQIVDLLPSGVVSGSSQVTASLDSRYLLINGDDVVSGSAQISFNGITDKPTLVSGSSQVSYPNLSNIPSGIISGSTQIIPLLPNGVVSGSSQVKSLLPEGTISGSSQVDADSITNFDGNVKDKLNSDGVISGSSFISNQQGSFTSSINGNETIVNLGLLESDTPTFQSINLESVELFGASELTSLFLSSSGELGKRVLGSAAFLNVSASVGDDPNSIPTNKAVSDALIAAGAGDITAVNDSTLYTSDYLGLEHTGDGTLNGGYGQLGNVVIALATGSVKFTEGVVKALPSGLISSSDQVSITQSQITDLIHYTDSDTLNYINSRGVISGSSQILEGSGLVSSSNQINQLIVGTSFSQSVDSRLDNAESANASGNDRLNALEFTSSSLNQFTSSIDITIKNKLNLDGVISGSSQLLAGSGIVSSSAQVSSYGVFAELNGDNLISSSQQIKSLLPNGVVSGSSQVDADSITNFDENVKDKLNVEGVISGSSQLLAGSGIVSSSAQISSYNTFLEINGDSVVSSSQQISDYNVFLEINGMGVLSGSDQVTGSLVDLISDQTISGTKTFTDIVVNGTGSFAYIQSTTGTAKIIGDSYIILNNDTPTQRYAGLAVYDSGSVTPTTASLNFDGQTNDWFYEYSSSTVDYGVVLFGPEYNTKGNPTYLTNNRIPKSEGSHHLNDSNISDSGTLITLGSAVDISGATNINNTTQSTSKTTGALIVDGGVGIAKTLNVGEDVVAYASSDRRLKDEITPIENSLQKINQIGGYSFVWNQNQHIYTGKDYGVIAQEIEEILPELVETRENGYKAVKYDRLVSLLIEGIKELSKEVSELKNKIKE